MPGYSTNKIAFFEYYTKRKDSKLIAERKAENREMLAINRLFKSDCNSLKSDFRVRNSSLMCGFNSMPRRKF